MQVKGKFDCIFCIMFLLIPLNVGQEGIYLKDHFIYFIFSSKDIEFKAVVLKNLRRKEKITFFSTYIFYF
jgi:hypothetical protein